MTRGFERSLRLVQISLIPDTHFGVFGHLRTQGLSKGARCHRLSPLTSFLLSRSVVDEVILILGELLILGLIPFVSHRCSLYFAHRFSVQFNTMEIRRHPVKNRIGDGGIPNGLVPVGNG